MKRIVNIFIATLTTFVFLFMTISYALETTETEEEGEETFFEVSSEEVTTGDTVEMVLNLSLVNSSSFVFTLTSSIDISTIYTDEESGVEILAEENDGEYTITIEITDSSLLEASEIALYYDLSDSVTSGTTITLTATVTDLDDKENTDSTETTITVIDSEKSNEDTEENYSNENENESDNDNMNNNEESDENGDNSEKNNEFESSFESENSEESDDESMMTGMSNDENRSSQEEVVQSEKSSDSTSASGSLGSSITEETVTYDGSSNNYLSELSIDGYSLNKDFDKESSTYFVTVSDVESVTVTATAEDSTATVCIYGTDSIEDGTNKVIISVTAENGSVRYYRIYISK